MAKTNGPSWVAVSLAVGSAMFLYLAAYFFARDGSGPIGFYLAELGQMLCGGAAFVIGRRVETRSARWSALAGLLFALVAPWWMVFEYVVWFFRGARPY